MTASYVRLRAQAILEDKLGAIPAHAQDAADEILATMLADMADYQHPNTGHIGGRGGHEWMGPCWFPKILLDSYSAEMFT